MSKTQKSSAIQALDKLYEFEQTPVSEDKLQPGKYFAGLFAGEHVAGTEFVIGAMFVSWGVNAYDIFLGLLLGNLMAVLTWTFICTPIAIQTRLTLYWYLRRIGGPVTTSIYNLLNAVLFCILAGCMITVSASAVRIPFNIPAQVKWYPEDIRFVLVVLAVGSVVVTLAILGFKKLSQFATVCSPWLLLMFFAGAVVLLPTLASNLPGLDQIRSVRDFWSIADGLIWTGAAPGNQAPMTFWQVAAFAWICNLAMHGGLSDMALFRYARKVSYGFYSAFGMFLGHYLAWIFAGIMGAGAALVLRTQLAYLDAGGVAHAALGVTGIIAVIIAGWTTSNPTLYRAGLAFQAVVPKQPRWLVTLVAGTVTTVIACFPFVFTKLLNFVGWYGLLLMPVGAIVFTEHWIFPKIGLTRYWVSYRKKMASWPALLSWGLGIGTALVLELTKTVHLFFLFMPIWILTSGLYIVFAVLAGAGRSIDRPIGDENEDDGNNKFDKYEIASKSELKKSLESPFDVILFFARMLTILSLLACLILPIWVFWAGQSVYTQRLMLFKNILIWPTLVYFIFGTVWAVKRNKKEN